MIGKLYSDLSRSTVAAAAAAITATTTTTATTATDDCSHIPLLHHYPQYTPPVGVDCRRDVKRFQSSADYVLILRERVLVDVDGVGPCPWLFGLSFRRLCALWIK
jgi:hypothetical protein